MKRLILKLSGELLAGQQHLGVSLDVLSPLLDDIKQLLDGGFEVVLIPGAGNWMRGASSTHLGFSQALTDQVGMLATVMNALLLREGLTERGAQVALFSAMSVEGVVPKYDRHAALQALSQQRMVMVAGGTGNPWVTTDSAASLRAMELGADAILKASHVDGVYTADPKKDPSARKLTRISCREACERQLYVMDAVAMHQCRDHGIPVCVFDASRPGALLRVLEEGSEEGTWMTV